MRRFGARPLLVVLTFAISTAEAAATIEAFDADVTLGSTVDLTWTVHDAESLEITCSDGAGGPRTTLATPEATETGANVPLPASDCPTVHLSATNPLADAEATITPANVVRNEHDDGPGSLRAVLASAPAGSVIGFASDVHDVALGGIEPFGALDAHLVIVDDVTISGPTGAPVTVRSDDTLPDDPNGIPVMRSRVFFVAAGAHVRLDGLVIADGVFVDYGGGVRNEGTLTLSNSVVANNRAFTRGGGVYSLGTLTIEATVLRGNEAAVTDDELAAGYACIRDAERRCASTDTNAHVFGQGGAGGAVYVRAGSLTASDSRIDGNTAVFSGGGIYVSEGASADVTDTDIVGNAATDAGVSFITYSFGGGVANLGTFTMTGGELSGNHSANVGGGLANGNDGDPDASMTITDVRITGNTAGQFGGGLIDYARDQEALVLAGATSVTGNTAGTSGDEVFHPDTD